MLTDQLYNHEMRVGWKEPERKGGREIFFHCMPAAAQISLSILVNSFREETADCVITVKGNILRV